MARKTKKIMNRLERKVADQGKQERNPRNPTVKETRRKSQARRKSGAMSMVMSICKIRN